MRILDSLKKWGFAIAQEYGLRAWGILIIQLVIAVIIIEYGTRGLLRVKTKIDSTLPLCYDYVTVRCRVPQFNLEFGRSIQVDALTGLSMAPNYQGEWINTNSLGFRGSEVNPSPTPGTLRVVVIGASAAFGWYVRDNETIAYYVQQKLTKELNQPVEVINAAVGTITSFQELMILETKVLSLKPNLVVIYDGYNDLYYASAPKWDGTSPSVQYAKEVMREVNNRQPSSIVNQTIQVAMRNSEFLSTLNLLYIAWIVKQQANTPTEFQPNAITVYQQNLKKIELISKNEDINLVFVLQPILTSDSKILANEEKIVLDRLDEPRKRVVTNYPQLINFFKKSAQENASASFLDYTNVFQSSSEHLYYDLVHYSPQGNQIIADRLTNDLVEVIKQKQGASK